MIDWSDVDTVMLDMDGTLLDLHFDNYFWQECVPEAYASIHGLTPAESKAVVYPRLEAERGNLNWYCLDHWSRELGLDIAAQLDGAEKGIHDARPSASRNTSRCASKARSPRSAKGSSAADASL